MTLPAPSPEDPFAPMLCFAIHSAGLAFNRLYARVLARWDLTYPQYLVLLALGERDGRSVGELGALLHGESNTLTPLIKRIAAAGHVERRRDPADERVVRVWLTEQGRRVVGELGCVPGEMLAATGSGANDVAKLPGLIAELDTVAQRLRDAAG